MVSRLAVTGASSGGSGLELSHAGMLRCGLEVGFRRPRGSGLASRFGVASRWPLIASRELLLGRCGALGYSHDWRSRRGRRPASPLRSGCDERRSPKPA